MICYLPTLGIAYQFKYEKNFAHIQWISVENVFKKRNLIVIPVGATRTVGAGG